MLEQIEQICTKMWLLSTAYKVIIIGQTKTPERSKNIFEGTGVQITTEGGRHLGAVIGRYKRN